MASMNSEQTKRAAIQITDALDMAMSGKQKKKTVFRTSPADDDRLLVLGNWAREGGGGGRSTGDDGFNLRGLKLKYIAVSVDK